MAADRTLRIQLLGGFRVSLGERAVPATEWRRSKAASVVKLLALAPGHRLHREQAMDGLWPDLAPAAAGANLRRALHYARRAIAADEGAGLIASVGESLSLPTAWLYVDVDAWRAATARARRSGEPAAYAEALEIYRGDLLPEDLYEEWACTQRDELQTELVVLLEELAGLLEARGEIDGPRIGAADGGRHGLPGGTARAHEPPVASARPTPVFSGSPARQSPRLCATAHTGRTPVAACRPGRRGARPVRPRRTVPAS